MSKGLRQVKIFDQWYQYHDLIGIPSREMSDAERRYASTITSWTHIYFGRTEDKRLVFTEADLEHAQFMHRFVVANYRQLKGHEVIVQYYEDFYKGTIDDVQLNTGTLTLRGARYLRRDDHVWFELQVKKAADKVRNGDV